MDQIKVQNETVEPEVNDFLKSIEVTLEEVTPEKASEWLERNTNNRPLKKETISKYVTAIEMENWQLTHQGIAFDQDGNIQDGQHRLHAVVVSGIPIYAFVFRNMPKENFSYLDIGKYRSLSDIIYISGVKDYPKQLSDIATFAILWENGTPFAAIGSSQLYKSGFTVNDVNKYIEENKDWMMEVTEISLAILKEKNLIKFKIIAGLLFLFGKYVDKKDTLVFANYFKSPIGLNHGHPIIHLLDILIKNVAQRGKKYTPKSKAALVIKAWNSFVKGETTVPIQRVSSMQSFPLIRNEQGKSVFKSDIPIEGVEKE